MEEETTSTSPQRRGLQPHRQRKTIERDIQKQLDLGSLQPKGDGREEDGRDGGLGELPMALEGSQPPPLATGCGRRKAR